MPKKLLVFLISRNIIEGNATLKTQRCGQPTLQVIEVGACIPVGADDVNKFPIVKIEVDDTNTNSITQGKAAR